MRQLWNRRWVLGAALLAASAPAKLRAAVRGAAASPAIDHVMVGVADLELAIARVAAATGVTPVVGGRHSDGGTWNALASLGARRYLELIAPDPAATAAARGGFWQQLHGLPEPTPLAVALAAPGGMAATEAKAAAAGIPGQPRSGARTTPDGEKLAWTGFDLSPDDAKGLFLIAWDAGRHPGETAPQGLRLDRLDITLPAAPRLGRQLAALGLDVPVAAGAARIVATVTGPKGSIVLG